VPQTVGIEYETLIDLAHDESKQGRAALVTAIIQLYDAKVTASPRKA
jgi:hypothetical protein